MERGQLLSYDSPLDVLSTSVGAPKKTAVHSPKPSSANAEKTYVSQDQPAATATAGNPCKDSIHMRRDRFAIAALCNNRPLEAAAPVRDRDSSDGDPHPPQLKTLRLCSISSSAAQQPHESDIVEEDDAEEEGEGGLCVTPTAREHRIPLEVLVCPPAPSKRKRKPAAKYYNSKLQIMKRPFCSRELSFDMNAININPGLQYSTTVLSPSSFSNIELCTAAAERRPLAFLITKPPDFHTLPECIRALFNIT